ncbi:hypothetical protein O3P69_004098 [Scylla paramamosain]|uniref:PPM-type phosphatase domain-containing protein n=1 Tax=Scylla paramamosain TaxID=85552 RepID=A0AAW0UF38_SCYPA
MNPKKGCVGLVAAEVDLSGRHLEQLPTSLFSSLHLTSINLSHNLLAPTPSAAAASARRRHRGHGRKRRDRRRRLIPAECRETPETWARSRPSANDHDCNNPAGGARGRAGEEDGLSGDSGVPSDPVEEESQRSDPESVPRKTPAVLCSFADELQEKLRQRKVLSEGFAVKEAQPRPAYIQLLESSHLPRDTGSRKDASARLCVPSLTPPPPYPPATSQPFLDEVSSSSSSRTIAATRNRSEGLDSHKEKGERGSYEDSSSSGVDESDNASEEGGEVTAAGEVWTAPARNLGALHQLRHFQQLQTVVLDRNKLLEFPSCLLGLPRLARLSLAHNLLCVLPHALHSLARLVELNVSFNHLVELGVGVCRLPALTHLRAAHNRIEAAPEVAAMEALRTLDLSENRVGVEAGVRRAQTNPAALASPAAEVDDPQDAPRDSRPLALNLRLNSLTGPVTLASIQNVTELDVSDNGITSLDVSCLSALASLTCCNNALTSLTLHAAALIHLSATNNRLTMLEVRYHPRGLVRLNLSRNQLEAVPPWLVSSTEVTLVDVSHNQISSLPAFLTSGHLRRLHTLSAHHNCLTAFPVPQPDLISCQNACCASTLNKITWGTHRSCQEDNSYGLSGSAVEEPKCCSLEVLYLHCNKIPALPSNLFSWLNRLRVLNVSKNQLSVLPGLAEGQGVQGTIYTHQDHVGTSKVTLSLQELYAAANRLRDLSPLQHCRALRILHAPYNRITSLPDKLVWSWELMEELVLSANQLCSVPVGVSRLSRLRVLKVHSNPLQSLPRLAHLSALKVVDASHCQLGHIELEEVVSPGLVALDISGNTALSLDHHQFTKCKSRRAVSLVDVTSCSGRSLPLTKPPSITQHSQQRGEGHRGNSENRNASSTLPWSLGFAEAIGRDSSLNVGQLRVPDVGGTGSVGVVAVADGGEEMGGVGTLLAALPSLLQEELACSNSNTYVLKYALLTALRRLRGQGGMLPSAVCAAHLEASPSLPGQWPVLRLCCYGPVSAVVTTVHGQPIVLTTSALRTSLGSAPECGEGVRCSLSEPPTLPDPHTTELHLGPHHSAIAIASASLWEVIEPAEAADICGQVSEPGSAAKHLLDLAQAYGSRQAISVIVVQLKPPAGMSQNSPLSIHEDSAISNKVHKHSNEVSLCKEYPEKAQHKVKDMTGTSRRVKFGSVNPLQDTRNQCYTLNPRKESRESFLCGGVNQVGKPCAEENHMIQNIGDLERSSPSGQSQSDCSEYWPDNDKEIRTTFREFSNEKSKDIFHPSTDHFYSYSSRKSKDGKKVDVASQIISYGSSKEKKTMTYYHYPRPEPGVVPSHGHLPQHLLNGSQTEPQTSVLAPPAGFGDPGSDSEGSDSGLSGVSGVQNYADHPSRPNFEDGIADNSPEQVTEEQFRSWEYLLARNAKLLYMRELDTLKKPETPSIKPTVSAPDLILAAAAEVESPSHFQRNVIRKSRLGRGTFRLIQNKLNATTSRFNTLQKLKVTAPSIGNFRRFGSLQNLKYYQENRPSVSQQPVVESDISAEMQERHSLDSLELETRMHHYWHTGITNF